MLSLFYGSEELLCSRLASTSSLHNLGSCTAKDLVNVTLYAGTAGLDAVAKDVLALFGSAHGEPDSELAHNSVLVVIGLLV